MVVKDEVKKEGLLEDKRDKKPQESLQGGPLTSSISCTHCFFFHPKYVILGYHFEE